MDDILEIIKHRRSIRRYKTQPLEEDTLKQLLEAAMAAPNACNSQPWEFVVVTDPELLLELRTSLRFANYQAPAAILVCGNLSIANNSAANHFWVQDCSAAVENILLAATGLGLGSVWIGIYPLPSVIKPVAQLFNLPGTVTPLALVYLGYPDEEKPSRTQYDENRIHWQTYQPRKKKAKIKNAKYAE